MRTALLLCVLWCGCKKEAAVEAPASPRAETEKQRASGKAEVEFFGKWSAGEVKAAKVIFVAQAEPCVPVPEKPTRFGEATLPNTGNLFAEFFIEQGTRGHACLYGLDETGKVVGASDTKGNPMTFEGQGEVMKSNLEFTLTAPAAN
jgi:hypothetical protein